MPLKILVTAKRVEDPEARIRVRPDGAGIEAEGVSYRLNPFDEVAVEEALRLREAHGGEVVVASIGGRAGQAELRAALAMGADRAVWIHHEGPLDPFVVSALLARLAQAERPDLFLLGKQAIDDDQAQVGPYLAERLGWPQATCATRLEALDGPGEAQRRPALGLSPDGRELLVVREIDGGVERLALGLPAVVTAGLGLDRPRFAPLPAVLKARRAALQELAAEALGVDLVPRVRVRRLANAPGRAGGIRVADVDELFRRLREEAKVF